MKRIIVLLIVALTPFLMGAGGACEPDVPVRPIKVVAHDYCIYADQLSWSVDDTSDTISGIRKNNAKYASRCGKQK